MDGLVLRYMDEETIRIFCFFVKNKFDPKSRCCKGCARFALCKRDAMKMMSFKGQIPWLQDDIDVLIEKLHGHQRCEHCSL